MRVNLKSIPEYFCTKKNRYIKCPKKGCHLIYCLDCVTYLGKRCVREGHDVEGVPMSPERELGPEQEDETTSIGTIKNRRKKTLMKRRANQHHRRNRSHHGVLSAELE